MSKDPFILLQHILECVHKIRQYTKDMDIDKFLAEEMVQDAVIRNFEIIGEATKQLSMDFRAEHPYIPWKKIAGMRDKLIHDYIGVDLWAVWAVVEKIIPEFEAQLQQILDSRH